MARTLLYSVSDFLILLLLLLLFLLIHESRSCPDSVYFQCHDNVYNGLPISLFTSSSLHDLYCGGPWELTCDYHTHQTMINCTEDDEPPYQVLYINPNNGTIVVEYPDRWLPPDGLNFDPCKVYSDLHVSFPSFQLVNLTITLKEDYETFLGCPYRQEDSHWDTKLYNNTTCGDDAIVYGPYDHGKFPAKKPPAGCIQFPNLSPKNDKGKEQYLHAILLFSPTNSAHKGKWKLKFIICSVLSGVAITILLILLIIVYWKQRNKKSGSTTPPSSIMSLNHTRSDLEEGSMNNGVTVFSYPELQEVTNNFDSARELGDGGFGVVYYGKLKDGREVAVKRMYEKNYKQVEQFKNEIKILTSIRHQNLVTLYGSTSRHSRELLLVYEYIPNGTVADHLHGNQSKSVLLLWPTRMKIAIETATALSYLHYNEIIHRDIKTNNILLDRNFCAKVADFGLSRLFPPDVTHVSTAPQGTPGYLDPEYHQCYHLTDKSDVYSFGVVLIELISSLPAIDMERQRHEVNLSNYAMNKIQCSALDELVDPNLGFEKNFKVRRLITLVAELAFQCLQHEREVRPSMEEVLEALKRIEGVDYDELEAEEIGKKTGTAHITNQTSLPTDSDDVEL